MIITYHGLEFFRLQAGDLVLGINAPSKDSDIKISRFGADIALATLGHEDMDGGSELVYGEKSPFFIKGPGEYEVKNVFIKGFPGESSYDGEEKINTIYTISMDNLNLCFLGAQSKTLTAEVKGGLGEIDVLFVPVGGEGVLDPSAAYKLAVSLEPRIIVPMHYNEKNLAIFLKEGSQQSADILEKLTIKRKDVEGKQGEIIVIKKT